MLMYESQGFHGHFWNIIYLKRAILPKHQQPKEEATVRGGRLGYNLNKTAPSTLPGPTWKTLSWKSSVHTEIVHICGYLLTWVCCADPPSIHFTRISLESLWLTFLTTLMGNSSVPRSEWMLPKPSVDVGNRTSGHEKKLYKSFEPQKAF